VGSGAIGLRAACLLGGVGEFLGATLLGEGVSDTIQQGVSPLTDPDCWACGYCDSKMATYVWGMYAALCAASLFMLIVTYCAMPISTTHATVGGVAGMTWVAIGSSCLNWSLQGRLGSIVMSWVLSPLVAGLVGVAMYQLTSYTVMRARNPVRNAFLIVPLLYGLTAGTMLFLVLLRAPVARKAVRPTLRAGLCLASVVVVSVIVHLAVMPGVRRDVAATAAKRKGSSQSNRSSSSASSSAESGSEASSASEDQSLEVYAAASQRQQQVLAKKVFQLLLVFTAFMESVAHGANDTANATGPFGAIYGAYHSGLYACSGQTAPWYVMAVAGLCVALGLNTTGRRVIETVGESICDIDFHIGFCVEFASAASVAAATALGMPVSTTHCQVEAIIFVGIAAHGYAHVSKSTILKIAAAWGITLPVSAGLSALLMLMRIV